MVLWSKIVNEIAELQKQNLHAVDTVRRKYLDALSNYTKRPAIVYASRWMQPDAIPNLVNITSEDLEGFIETAEEFEDENLDLIIHSPGGQLEATETIVNYLRTKFKNIRVIIPHSAMSAATLLAFSSNEIVMSSSSNLGPIDPQILIPYQGTYIVVPAQAIIDEFEQGKKEIKENPSNLGIWAIKINNYWPGLLKQSSEAITLSKDLAIKWLTKYMLKDIPHKSDKDLIERAEAIANYFADHAKLKSHARPIFREEAKALGLKIVNLEEDKKFEELVMSVYHAFMITFTSTLAQKIIENNKGRAYIKLVAPPTVQQSQKQQQA